MQSSSEIKACLDRLLERNALVFIFPHNRPDMDALGSSIGMSLICNKKGIKNYIVIDDDIEKIESVTRKVICDIENNYKIINCKDIEKYITDKSLMICVDVNKNNLINVSKYNYNFNDIFILDHHKTDEHTIKTNNIFADDKLSSTCEEITRLLSLYKVELKQDEANYILAGIVLDTNKLNSPKVNSNTLNKNACR